MIFEYLLITQVLYFNQATALAKFPKLFLSTRWVGTGKARYRALFSFYSGCLASKFRW